MKMEYFGIRVKNMEESIKFYTKSLGWNSWERRKNLLQRVDCSPTWRAQIPLRYLNWTGIGVVRNGIQNGRRAWPCWLFSRTWRRYGHGCKETREDGRQSEDSSLLHLWKDNALFRRRSQWDLDRASLEGKKSSSRLNRSKRGTARCRCSSPFN